MASRIAQAAYELGMRSIKITGGEPLMRLDLEDLISQMPSALKISMTTNGIYLAERAASLANSGLDRLNISLDTLKPHRYRSIAGGREGDLDRVLKGIDAALQAGLQPAKLNMVVLKENQEEVGDMIAFSREKGLILQLIELMDLKGLGIGGDLGIVEQMLEAHADRIDIRKMHRRKKYFLDAAEVEVVRPMDNTEFCANCTRIRVTSDGRLKPCLLRNDNLLKVETCDKEEIKRLLLLANSRREPYFRR